MIDFSSAGDRGRELRKANGAERRDVPALPSPTTTPDEIESAIRALVRASCIMRNLLTKAAGNLRVRRLLVQHEQVLLLADAVVSRWAAHFGIPEERDDE
jgi:hypothetical protein